ncbi:hypothetical protein [Pectobacterium aroidearum]|uniref:hypothetical protein n=1 Tax=Pectobacterium aroidearum TaxID=1201031 RepID=UPI00301795AC
MPARDPKDSPVISQLVNKYIYSVREIYKSLSVPVCVHGGRENILYANGAFIERFQPELGVSKLEYVFSDEVKSFFYALETELFLQGHGSVINSVFMFAGEIVQFRMEAVFFENVDRVIFIQFNDILNGFLDTPTIFSTTNHFVSPVEQVMSSLSNKTKMVFALYVCGFNYLFISSVLNLSVSAAEKRVRSVKHKIALEFESFDLFLTKLWQSESALSLIKIVRSIFNVTLL